MGTPFPAGGWVHAWRAGALLSGWWSLEKGWLLRWMGLFARLAAARVRLHHTWKATSVPSSWSSMRHSLVSVGIATPPVHPWIGWPADRDNMSEGGPTPTLYTAPILASVPRPVPTAGTPAGSATPAAAAAAPTPAAVVVRTVSKAHPLTPSRQVVLEEEEQVGLGRAGQGCCELGQC